ncbi:MAG TPA: hypothetical protein VHC19_11900 [Pirellulales bacterium]|nr:hypothetical protein [Pirellulales bacterium]
MKLLAFPATIIGLLFFIAAARAEKNAELAPSTTKPGEVLVQDAFDEPQLSKAWAVNKGDWQIAEGALIGREKAEDKHAAVLTLKQPNRNSLLKFSFKLDGAKGFNVSFNHAKGHLFRIGVGDKALTLIKDQDKRDPDSKRAVLARAAGAFSADTWYTMLVEIQGDKVSVQIDNGLKTSASHADLDVDKTGYRFVTRSESLLLDDVTVWRVAP